MAATWALQTGGAAMRSNSLRATILMACPRIVRIGLNPSVATSLEPAAIAEDIVRFRPGFLPQARMWVKSATGRTSLARPWSDMQNAHRHTSRLVRGLDKLAAKSPAASELADCMVLMTAAANELLSASRLTNRLWHSVGQLAELRSAVRIEEWRPLPETIFDNLPPEVVLDQQGADDLIDKVRKILGEIESETTELAIGMSLLAAGNTAPENNCRSLAELARQLGASPGLMRNLNDKVSIPSFPDHAGGCQSERSAVESRSVATSRRSDGVSCHHEFKGGQGCRQTVR